MTSSSDFSSKFPPFHTGTFLSEFFWLFIIFGFFYWIMHRFILPRLYFVMEMRRNKISDDKDNTILAKKEVDSIVSSYEELLVIARKNAKEIVDMALINADNHLDSQRKILEKDLSNKLLDAQSKIDDMQNKASKEIRFVVEEVTKDLVRKIGFPVSDVDVQSTIKMVIDQKRG
ncbi:hypothetical protein HUT03_05145 [Candidatus Liberibacter africanus]|uniref:ATP synthase F(0) sector subunit b 2 n=1 Tax=Candidatus Liberibacter africanus PTSAPSY TaxID=1277257 RepID=A0A0G3I5T1_LIBAF|nr:ATP synthase F0F1 subunit B [Candidatus Liberibacter africanus]AKK20625.1 F0F1 ATP synthase subunit B' [Candidatus Liberibacter africanus PTSAPSY]QTP64307.1 hypothetical protein HUT03_05145 [Candidatus Liberibacter africanus]